ncbi:sugar transferase [Pontibacillus halophilus JSM 076056 = DSM 19796]|uniref:Sugar transferase n=1 Tax=Pontibacillus halophilus JSM 076056 = DSM 19796 TaxID=1385510 RepID=A0A0A5GIG5_9BACI|nr:sugar transferase [Pontibacillus halophilus]KGX93016.1 sugar transferase [Pontibacillus halophilus JSM 076056 = DSM 19796]
MDQNKRYDSFARRLEDKSRYSLVKRCTDVLCSIALLILMSPLLILISLLILWMDGMPIVFKQTRTGMNGEPFTIWKFRTMRQHNFEDEHQYDWGTGVPNQFVFKSSPGKHVTKLGMFLRKTSLDEIPQLVNVIRGDMSLIGPRPEIPAITDLYNEEQSRRLDVKPGLTGFAQVHGRSDMTHGEKINYDLHYVERCCLLLDLSIIWKTIKLVISSKGSY